MDEVFLSSSQEEYGSHAHSTNNVDIAGSGKWLTDQYTNVDGFGTMEDEASSRYGASAGGTSSSFVDAILDQEREMMMEFPDQFLSDPNSLM